MSHVLPDYREKISGTPLKYTLISTAQLAQVVVRHYELLSQHWSPDDMVTPTQWRHNVDIYIPETAKEHHALVVVNNGINYDKGVQITGKPGDFPQETLASIARDTNTIVISVSDIPNQYLTFQDDKKPLKEDESVSRSWALFMEAPEQRELMPLNIPMVTALSQAMRLAKKELTQWNINSFIITGISKRGWTTWLSAIADPDVEAIVPFAIDLLDIDASLEHIYQSYGGNWPITFYPYYQQGIDEKIKSTTFTQLRQIIDPLRYLNTIYQPRLAIPKYIINASGDDFFVPDNTRFYYSKLPGVKSLRIVPNMNHYSINQFAEESLVPFINRFQSKKTLPQLIGLIHHHLLTVYFSEAPVKVVRWTANNPNARDFRYACGIRYQPLTIDIPANNKISITLNEPKTGWEATYIEATFNDGYVATSQVYITPDEKYPQTAPPSVNAACQTLHLDIKEISIATVIPWVIGAIGMVLGGVCSDVIYRITGNALLSRRLILGVCLAGAAVCVAVSGTVSTIGSAITLMSVSLFLLYLTGPIYWAVIQDVVHKDKVGSVGGAMHGLANISGIIGPLVTGFIVQFSGKYDYAFYLAGAIAIVSSLLVFVFVKSKGFKANESQSCVH